MGMYKRLTDFLYRWKLRDKVIFVFLFLFGLWGSIIVIQSYNQSVRIMEDHARSAMGSRLAQINLHLSNLMDEAEQVSNMLYTNIELQQILKDDESIYSNKLTQLKNYHSISSLTNGISNTFYGALDIKMYIADDILYASEGKVFDKITKLKDKAWYQHMVDGNVRNIWVSNNCLSEDNREDRDQLRFCRIIRSGKSKDHPSAIVVSVDENQMQEIFRNNDTNGNNVYLVDHKGVVLYANNQESRGLPKHIVGLSSPSDGIDQTVTYDHVSYLISRQTLDNHNLYLIAATPYGAVVESNLDVRNYGFLSILLIVGLSIMLVSFIFMGYVKRFKKISTTMATVRSNNFMRIESKYSDELGEIEQNYDQMVVRLKELMDQVYQTGMQAKDAEMKALQAQINPHFLYNTLDAINWMAVDIEAYNIATMVTSLGKFFRMILKTKDMISIQSEIELLTCYMYIQQERMKDALELRLEIDDTIMAFTAMKLTLQPIVENAIKHGFINKNPENVGIILVRGYREADSIIFEVRDNGVGLVDKPNTNHVNHDPTYQSGYGLYNIEERLKLYFNDDCSVEITNAEEGGAVVTICWPAIPYDKDKPIRAL